MLQNPAGTAATELCPGLQPATLQCSATCKILSQGHPINQQIVLACCLQHSTPVLVSANGYHPRVQHTEQISNIQACTCFRWTVGRKTSSDSRTPSPRNSWHFAGTSEPNTAPQWALRPIAPVAKRVPARPTGPPTGWPHPNKLEKSSERSGTRPVGPHHRYPPHPARWRHRHHQSHPSCPPPSPSQYPSRNRSSHTSWTNGGTHQTQRQGPWNCCRRCVAKTCFAMPRPKVGPANPRSLSTSSVCFSYKIRNRGRGPCPNRRDRSQSHPHHLISRRRPGLWQHLPQQHVARAPWCPRSQSLSTLRQDVLRSPVPLHLA